MLLLENKKIVEEGDSVVLQNSIATKDNLMRR